MITGPPGVGKSEFTIWIAGRCRRSVLTCFLIFVSTCHVSPHVERHSSEACKDDTKNLQMKSVKL